jgi:hypothetical protein
VKAMLHIAEQRLESGSFRDAQTTLKQVRNLISELNIPEQKRRYLEYLLQTLEKRAVL